MDEYLLTEDEIAEYAIVCWEALAKHEQESYKRVCHAQLAKLQPLLAAAEEKGRQEERERIRTILNTVDYSINTSLAHVFGMTDRQTGYMNGRRDAVQEVRLAVGGVS